MRRFAALLVFACLPLLAPSSAEAADRLCDTRKEDCRVPLWTLINNEPAGGGIDVAFWFMTDDNYRQLLQKAHERGVRVRILMDPRANPTKPGNVQILAALAAAGVPMRKKAPQSGAGSDILHWKMMLFERQQNGKPVVQFSAANYTPDSFKPSVPYQNYIDEVVYITDDPRITGTFRTKFEDYWTDTTGKFLDYANVAPPYPRYYPIYPQDPALNFTPTQNYESRAITNYNREIAIGAANGAKIDVIMYRFSDEDHGKPMIKAFEAGIPVRFITEQENYRDSRYIWHSYNVDKLWAAGIPVKDHVNAKEGITHQKSVILYAQKQVIFGTSNWSTASSNQQYEHNLFSTPCTAGQVTWCDGGGPNNMPANWVFNWFVKQFNDKWNSVNPTGFVEFKPFVPLPGGVPINYKPANGALGVVGTSVTLDWDGGIWNHRFDVYLGTDPTNLSRVGENLAVGSPYADRHETWLVPATLSPGTKYYWRIVAKTMANLTRTGPTWSFTTAGSGSPPAAAPSLTVTSTGPTRVSLAWNDVAGETQYLLERSPSATTGFVQIATTGANVTSYTDSSGLSLGTTYYYRLRAGNANGYSAYSAVVSARTLSGISPDDVALYAGQAPVRQGAWAVTPDGTAAGGFRLFNPDAGLAKVVTPAANPVDYFELTFNAQAGRAYRLWMRGKALNSAYTNDSVWVQFSDSVDASNGAAWRIGSTSGIALSVEECSGCGLSAWGWHDSGWGVGVRGVPVYFATSGSHRIRVQRREDGISIDQIVLSPVTFFTSAPGATKNDTTILPASAGTP